MAIFINRHLIHNVSVIQVTCIVVQHRKRVVRRTQLTVQEGNVPPVVRIMHDKRGIGQRNRRHVDRKIVLHQQQMFAVHFGIVVRTDDKVLAVGIGRQKTLGEMIPLLIKTIEMKHGNLSVIRQYIRRIVGKCCRGMPRMKLIGLLQLRRNMLFSVDHIIGPVYPRDGISGTCIARLQIRFFGVGIRNDVVEPHRCICLLGITIVDEPRLDHYGGSVRLNQVFCIRNRRICTRTIHCNRTCIRIIRSFCGGKIIVPKIGIIRIRAHNGNGRGERGRHDIY